jgi:molecular chaperone GrpE
MTNAQTDAETAGNKTTAGAGPDSPAGGEPVRPAAAAQPDAAPAAASVTAESATSAAAAVTAADGGRSAEVRELERQLDELRQKLKDAEDRARDNLDRWQRAQADLANYRRRSQFEREELEKYALAAFISALLPVLDSFERAWQTLPGQFRRLTWLSGVNMIQLQLHSILERIGVSPIDAQGQAFDAALHEAVDREEGDGPPHVIAVLQTGYKLHERVLRPALVKVGPQPTSTEGATAGDASAAGETEGQAAPPAGTGGAGA